jgi:ubiquinone/menaquinone biosynthesis C-methylase UbiE
MSGAGDRWGAIESAADPDWFVRFLDRTSTRPGEHHRALPLLALGPGQRCLDAGCGVGEDARAISELSGAQVVGVDVSSRMVSEARSRSAERDRVTFLAADARRLPFLDSTFDAAWVKRTLMHLASPAEAIAEMARVVRPAGRIVAVEPDLEVVLLDSGMADVTRRLLAHRATGYASPWAGRQLRRLMLEAGLTEVRAMADPAEMTDLASTETALRLVSLARTAAQRGILADGEASRWEEDLRSRDARGLFACYVLGFVAVGRVPAAASPP